MLVIHDDKKAAVSNQKSFWNDGKNYRKNTTNRKIHLTNSSKE